MKIAANAMDDSDPIVTGAVTLLSPGDDDDIEDGEGDWTDVDDEDFEDMAADQEDLYQIKVDNDIFDPDDDDHLPDDDD